MRKQINNPDLLLLYTKLRQFAVILSATLLLAAHTVDFLNFTSFSKLMLPLVLLVGMNSLTQAYLDQKKKEKGDISQQVIAAHIGIDVTIFSLILAFTGSGENPFSLLYLTHLLILPFFLSLPYQVLMLIQIIGLRAGLSLVPKTWSLIDWKEIEIDFSLALVPILGILVWATITYLLNEQKKKELALDKFRQKRERMDRLKALGALTSGLLHEISTPINTTGLFLERMKRKKDLPSDQEIELALDSLNQCQRAIGQTGLRSQNMELESFYPQELIEEVIYRHWAKERIHFKKLGIFDQLVMAPKLAFMTSLIDLFDNAAQAGTEEIEVQLNREEQKYTLSIINQGQVPSIVLQHFGEPFTTTKENGTGLGLYNALSLIQGIGGELTIENLERNKVLLSMEIPIWEQEV